jgi:hypothetical protein
MATPAEYTLGTNAALPKAVDDVQAMVPDFARGMVTAQKLAPVVADIVKIALDKVDAARAKEQST